MVIPDVNLLLHAYAADSPHHAVAAAWWQALLSGTEPVGIPVVVCHAFVRVGTQARAFALAMSVSEAADHIRAWLAQPSVSLLPSHPNDLETTLALLEAIGTAGNLVTDAQIAALALLHGGVVHTADADFARFPGLRWHNPLTGAGSARRN